MLLPKRHSQPDSAADFLHQGFAFKRLIRFRGHRERGGAVGIAFALYKVWGEKSAAALSRFFDVGVGVYFSCYEND